MDNVTLELIIILILIIANGLFAMSEIAVISSRKTRLENMARKGNLKSKTALDLANSPSKFLSTVQVGVTTISVITGAVSGATLGKRVASVLRSVPLLAEYADVLGYTLVVAGITYFTLVIGELVPKRVGMNNPEKIALKVSGSMKALAKIGSPLVALLSHSTDFVIRFLKLRPPSEPNVTEEEIRMLISQGNKVGVIEKAEQDILESVFRLGDKRVEAVMTPRTKIVWLDVNSTSDENKKIILESHFSHFPVCDENLDNLKGIVSIKELYYFHVQGRQYDIKTHVSEPLFIPEGTRALKLLDRFKESGKSVAIVINEYGGVEGLVTITDLVEEVLGELSRQDHAEPFAKKREDGFWLVDGMIPVDEFKRIFKLESLPGEEDEDFQTLGGFIMLKMERIPKEGEKMESVGLSFEILDMDGNRIDKVLVQSVKKP
ncbi:MAG: HlyC/CorC family transporter [Ignavibacteria bacterium]|jgi:putative hemolysin|nr:HlyC/CorC family transporter [Ignavibacteria bacterium]MCU7502784.1 HlyC/CorC family transporter [Ignavibacteria bacterium]MCU7518376.1 HlyC/CorC family transporter [Ignavibacteria bacterium]